MHGLGAPHDHGAALDAASHGQYQTHLVHSLVNALNQRVNSEIDTSTSRPPRPMRMPEVSDLVELKSRLCLREG